MDESIDKHGCPIASDNLRIEETGTDIIIFDPEAQLFHFINRSAYTIFKACNGSNGINDIAAILSEEFKFDDLDALVIDVKATIDQFREKGLVE